MDRNDRDEAPVAGAGAERSPPPLPRGTGAAWWAWPLVALCLLPLDWAVDRLPVLGEETDRVPPSPAATSSGDLALLKFQGQVVIASDRIDPGAAEESLDALARGVSGERGVAALALLEGFVRPDSLRAGDLLERHFAGKSGDLVETTRRAVRDGVDEEERARLRRELGWFADLARSPGLAEPPDGAAIRSRAFVVMTVAGLLLTAVVFALLCGAVLLVIHLRRVHADPSANAFVPRTAVRGVLLESFAIYLGLMSAGSLLGAWFGFPYALAGYGAAAVVPLLWPGARGVPWRDFLAAAGLHRGRGWWREIGAGCVGYLGVLAIASIGVFLTLALSFAVEAIGGVDGTGPSPGSAGPEIHPIVGWIYSGDLGLRLACLFLAAGFAPFFEELFFRGALYRHLRGRLRFFPAALVSSLIFAALHPQGLYGIPALAAMGVGFSLLREWRDSLVAPMTAHAINNGGLVLMLWWVL